MFGLSPLEELVLVSAVVFGLYWCGRAMRSLFRRLFRRNRSDVHDDV